MNTYCLEVSNDDNASKILYVDADTLEEAIAKYKDEYGKNWPYLDNFSEL